MVTLDLEAHAVINGRSSSGKTYFFREAIFKRTRKRVVFLNTQHEEGFGRPISRWDVRHLAHPSARVNLCPPTLTTGNEKALQAFLAPVVDDLLRIGQRVARDRRGLVVVAVDEAHLISPKHSAGDPLRLLATNGNRYGLKLVAITQRPALLSHTVLSQAPVHVLFDLDDYERAYLDAYAVPDHVRRWIRDPLPGAPPGTPNRRFAVRIGTSWHLCRPI